MHAVSSSSRPISPSVTTAKVTGASSGIGLELAKAFVAEGAQVVLAARREDRLQAAVEQLNEAAGGEVGGFELHGRPGAYLGEGYALRPDGELVRNGQRTGIVVRDFLAKCVCFNRLLLNSNHWKSVWLSKYMSLGNLDGNPN